MLYATLSDVNRALTTRVSELEDELNTWMTITPDMRDLGYENIPGALHAETYQS
jgi:hypothetical protein